MLARISRAIRTPDLDLRDYHNRSLQFSRSLASDPIHLAHTKWSTSPKAMSPPRLNSGRDICSLRRMGSPDRRMWPSCSSGLTGTVIRDDLVRTTATSVHDRYQSTTKAESVRLTIVPNDICSPTSDALDVTCSVKIQSGHGSSANRCCGRVERGWSFLNKPFHFPSEESSNILGSDSVNLRHDKSGQIDHTSYCFLR